MISIPTSGGGSLFNEFYSFDTTIYNVLSIKAAITLGRGLRSTSSSPIVNWYISDP
jgi:hypothetical protein